MSRPTSLSPEHKQAIKEACQQSNTIGRWKRTEDWIEKMSNNLVGKFALEKNPAWKGEAVGYHGIHKWVARHYGKPGTCERCGLSGLTGHSIHWANISLDYKRDIEDWLRLCAKCHKSLDKNRKQTKYA